MNNQITFLIPSFNEGSQLHNTVTLLRTNFSNIPIIVVDDGSTDGSTKELNSIKNITVLSNPTNLGKSAAVQNGLSKITTPWVFLFDADLSELHTDEIWQGIDLLETTKHSMIVFAQQLDPAIWQLLGLHIMVSGERIINTETLRQFFRERCPTQYGIEISLHKWFASKKMKFDTTPMRSKNKFKLAKWDTLTALKKSWEFYKYLLSSKE